MWRRPSRSSSTGLLSYAVLIWLGATLTLPGIAGFVLAIGMAVDANVLVYERAKEEYAVDPTLGRSLEAGFQRAWSAILDANVTTLLAAVLLFFLAAGAVRGFGVTLTIGVLVSMFSALVVTRVLLEMLSRIRFPADPPPVDGLDGGAALPGMAEGLRPQPVRQATALADRLRDPDRARCRRRRGNGTQLRDRVLRRSPRGVLHHPGSGSRPATTGSGRSGVAAGSSSRRPARAPS